MRNQGVESKNDEKLNIKKRKGEKKKREKRKRWKSEENKKKNAAIFSPPQATITLSPLAELLYFSLFFQSRNIFLGVPWCRHSCSINFFDVSQAQGFIVSYFLPCETGKASWELSGFAFDEIFLDELILRCLQNQLGFRCDVGLRGHGVTWVEMWQDKISKARQRRQQIDTKAAFKWHYSNLHALWVFKSTSARTLRTHITGRKPDAHVRP